MRKELREHLIKITKGPDYAEIDKLLLLVRAATLVINSKFK